MTFRSKLRALNYKAQDYPTGQLARKDRNGNTHTYIEMEEGFWSYTRHDSNGQIASATDLCVF
jgi:hypothetical protein